MSCRFPARIRTCRFPCRCPGAGALGAGALEWSGSNLATVFAQRRNLLRPRFRGMLRELLRFNQLCTALAESGEEAALAQPLGDFLRSTALAARFAIGISCPCWAACGAARPTKCCAFQWLP